MKISKLYYTLDILNHDMKNINIKLLNKDKNYSIYHLTALKYY